MKNYSFITLFFISLAFYSCKNDKTASEPEIKTVEVSSESKEYQAAKADVEFNDSKIGNVYNAYIDLKTSLVNTNASTAASASSKLGDALVGVDADEPTLEAVITISQATDVEEQRKAFVVVTKAVEAMLEGAIESGQVYKQYCPMAFNNKGAYWLSNSKEINNPYFGDKMLKCGRVTAEIK